jgi:hypothetical protein
VIREKRETANVATETSKAHPFANLSSFIKKEISPPSKGININNKTIISSSREFFKFL